MKNQQLDLFSANKNNDNQSKVNKTNETKTNYVNKSNVKPSYKVECEALTKKMKTTTNPVSLINLKNKRNCIIQAHQTFYQNIKKLVMNRIAKATPRQQKIYKKLAPMDLDTSVKRLPTVGLKTVQKLKKLGIKTLYDLITYFPFRYMDYSITNLADANDKQGVSLSGRLTSNFVAPKYSYCKVRMQYGVDKQHLHQATIMFFHKNWLRYKFQKGDLVQLSGTYSTKFHTVTGDRIHKISHIPRNKEVLKPVYPLTQGLKQYTLEKLINLVAPVVINQVQEKVPKKIRIKHHLEPYPQAIIHLQFPKTTKQEAIARHTIKFDELYQYEIKVQRMKQRTTHKKGISIKFNPQILRKFDDNLPFTMTSGQIRSVKEIVMNLYQPTQMNRLLQGDVGSGKTIVSAFGILATISAGYQVALMVPTGVLAEQHAKSFAKVFKGYGINIGLLTGETTDKEKNALLYHLATGDINFIIGTDALIQPNVKFKKLGLAVIDEQHKFGVDQRETLIEKGTGVNGLAMTATPIPRTLEITTYGDMDISIIDTLPKGRKPIKTKWIHPRDFMSIVPKVKNLLQQGQQAYLVVPLVQQTQASLQEDKSHQKADALSAYHNLQKIFAPYKVGLLHGQMDDDKKDQVMKDFQNHKFSLLVSTTVIEVGVDVSDATVMIICNADNFGLATLHQLRGRVGRNSLQSYCWLVAHPKTDNGVKRMKVMEHTNNGFVISQADLQLRGGGDLFGENQSGVPKFKCADVIADADVLNEARIEAQKQTVISSKQK